MPRQAYPARPGSGVFADGWADYHRKVAESQMLDACVITRAASSTLGAYSAEQGKTTFPPPEHVWEGPCRTQALPARSTRGDLPGREITVLQRRVSIPADAPAIQIGDLVTILACETDPTMVGRDLWTVDVLEGTLIWQRDLICDATPPVTR